jgi:hypothetical protein
MYLVGWKRTRTIESSRVESSQVKSSNQIMVLHQGHTAIVVITVFAFYVIAVTPSYHEITCFLYIFYSRRFIHHIYVLLYCSSMPINIYSSYKQLECRYILYMLTKVKLNLIYFLRIELN